MNLRMLDYLLAVGLGWWVWICSKKAVLSLLLSAGQSSVSAKNWTILASCHHFVDHSIYTTSPEKEKRKI